MIELTAEQHDSLANNGSEPIRAIDLASRVEYVLLRAEVYERLKALLVDDLPDAAPLVNELMREDDLLDPYLESYQHYEDDGCPRFPTPLEPRDDWERGLLGAAKNCGVSLPNWAVSSDGLYD